MPVRQANNPVKPVGFTQSPVQRPASTFQYISQQRFALGQIHAKRFYRQFTAARSSGPAGVVRRRRRLGKRPPPGPSWPQPPALCQLTQTRVGLFQAEPIRLQRAEFVQSSIDALKALVEHSAEQIPGPCGLTRAGLGQHLNTSLQPYGIGHCGTLSLPLQH
jgi:hypothetical protein